MMTNPPSPPDISEPALAQDGPAASLSIKQQIEAKLNEALELAESDFGAGKEPELGLSQNMMEALSDLSSKSERSSTGFTNIMTSVAIKCIMPAVDVRYHQVQIQKQTEHGAGFNFRGVSENTIYPWLSNKEFNGAKSGWQTRTFERPKPYMLSYDENIGDIKASFLTAYDELSTKGADAFACLRFLLYKQVEQRAKKKIKIAEPKTTDISLIIEMLEKHFSGTYRAKGASRLPVLAFHAIYAVLVREMRRFDGKTLRSLEMHSAADSQTGAVGDIEVANADGTIYEALEIKHGLAITEKILEDVKRKIMDKHVDRYYVLTTHPSGSEPGLEVTLRLIQAKFDCQVIVNGVKRSLWYYLRLLADPSSFIPEYAKLLRDDKAISFEHREAWNRIATA
ncbi:hypothetical protein [Xanthomonas oryzae]|uniref:hypothetical protein n=1 Tax=Xanthomonas oryzae TaxID=347 RepID=UPI00349E77E4